jgi:hypothetical protein
MNVLGKYSHTTSWKPKDVSCTGGRDRVPGQAEQKRSRPGVGRKEKGKRERKVRYREREGTEVRRGEVEKKYRTSLNEPQINNITNCNNQTIY